MDIPISFFNNKLIAFLEKKDISLGLANGKMGLCIYFYTLSQIHEDASYKETAERLLGEIFDSIDSVNTIDVRTGLAGIALAVDYLIKHNFVKGDVNNILSDVDDLIFKNLLYTKNSELLDSLSLIHILYFLCIRLKVQKKDSENEYLYKELIIKTINDLYKSLPSDFNEEPLSYTVDYIIPQLLFVLCEIYQLDFYNYRLIKIIEELSYKVLSTFPILHSNRLYLLWAMDKLNKHIKNRDWSKHITLLKKNIDIEYILNHELRDKNIYFNDGLTSIYGPALSVCNRLTKNKLIEIKKQAIKKIHDSEAWGLLNESSLYFKSYIGLYNGFTGVSLLLNKL